jgi:CDP-glycerol glycerophosphotransferase (TagB/SpsB family)
VRVHPNYLLPGGPSHAGYARIAERHPHMHVDVPDVRSERLRIDRASDDSLWLGALFKHCDVLVNVFSTTTLEAFLLDRPVVLVAEEVGLDGGSAGRGWAEFDHLRALTRYGAGRVAHRLEDIPVLVAQALATPDADRDARLRVAEEECGPLDGRAGERVGRRLLELAGAPTPSPAAALEA